MNSLLPILLIALFGLIKSRMEESSGTEAKKKSHGVGLPDEMQQAIKQFQGTKEKTGRGHGREADYKDLPIEVQRAIKSFQQPEAKPVKKETRAREKEWPKKKRQMDDAALKQATEAALAAHRAEEEAPVAPRVAEPEAAKPSPFAAIEKFDEAYRPFIYSEVFNKPKCKRK